MEFRESKLDINTPTQIIFDQYSRYLACSKLLQNAGLNKGASMLDVGSGPECLFGSFLPDIQITYLDPLISVEDGQHIKGDIFSEHLNDLSFSAVVAVDVLEHVPPDRRNVFLKRVSELSSDVIVLGFPNSDTLDASQLDLALEQQYRNIYGSDYYWLQEHHEYGLPSLKDTQAQLEHQGWYCHSVGHGHTPWLRELLGFVICAWDNPLYKNLIVSISERFNEILAQYDFSEPSYRQFIIATRQRSVTRFQPSDTAQTFEEANRLFDELMQYARTEFYKLALRPMDENPPIYMQLLKERTHERDRAREERDKALVDRALSEARVQQAYNSTSWRLTRPLRVGARLVRHGLTKQDRQKLIQALRNQYHSLPIPRLIKGLVSRVYHQQLLRKFFVGVHRNLRFEKTFQLPDEKLKSQQYGKPDYIIWGVIDWHFRHQRPQQIALALAATGRRVFYISPLLVDDQGAGFEVEALDTSKQLFQIKLFANNAPSIYMDEPNLETAAQLKQSLGEVLNWTESKQINSLVDHPFWLDIAVVVPNSRLIYDCMDHHAGFGSISDSLLQLEKRLLAEAELAICTSSWLKESVSPHAKQTILIRNAADYVHFSYAYPYRDPKGRRIIGYYGAIAEWFDLDLIEAVAIQHPDCCVLLVGSDTVDASSRLSKFKNITFLGEVPYEELPYYLHGFDVCLLPFKVTPLTLATNPVKIYEYMCAGKPVVAVDLPEMAQFEGLVYSVTGKDAFLDSLKNVLSQPEPEDLIWKRRAFAQHQTWRDRTETLIKNAESSNRDPRVSVIVVTYNNLNLTKECLSSLELHSQYQNLEIIVVDNASKDGTLAYLNSWVMRNKKNSLILNSENRGFAAANNQGLEVATGDYLVLLNNDTYVTLGWIRTLIRHIETDKNIGLIGPVTNNIGNEARVNIDYGNMDEMQVKSLAYTRRHIGQTYPLRTAAFFCVMMPRSTYERVGPLDEAFGRGFFEDDDYCRRVEQLGLRIVCAEDVFIHHHLSASFDQLKQHERQKLFEKNKAIYEAKWGEWVPHGYRDPEPVNQDEMFSLPAVFQSQKYFAGTCIACGKSARFFYQDVSLWRESLICEHCYTTSRYRSIARGLLLAINELTGIEASSLSILPRAHDKRLSVYDTQPPFYFGSCSYPLPELLKTTKWIDVKLSQYRSDKKLGKRLSKGVTNQNLECLTFPDASLDIIITSDVMEHVRLDDRAHREIYRVLKPGGIYLFTVPHDRSWENTVTRVQITDPGDPAKDIHLLEPEYHGDTNSPEGTGVLAYRAYGRDLEVFLAEIGFEVIYEREDYKSLGIMNTELYFCRKQV